MTLNKELTSAIDHYVNEHLGEWINQFGSLRIVGEREMEIRERIVRVEKSLERQFALMGQGFERMDRRFEEIRGDMDKRFEEIRGDMDKRFERMDKRFEEIRGDMNKRFEQVDKRFERMDKHFEEIRGDMNKRFEQVDKRFEQMDRRFEELRGDMKTQFNRVYGFLTGLFVVVLGAFITLVIQVVS